MANSSFTRKELRSIIGDACTNEMENRIMALYLSVVDPMKDDLAKYKALAEKLDEVQKKLDEATSKDWKSEAEKIQKDFDDYKKDQTAKETKVRKQDAYRGLLKEAGIPEKRLEAVLKVSNIDGISLDKDGNIEGKDVLLKGIKEEWADFIPVKSSTGTNNPTPPASNGGSVRKTKEEIYAIKDPKERQQAIMDNHELFGI